MAMNPEIKQRWVERLRSLPPEAQGKHMLKDANTGQMCCLGVLTEIAVEDGVIEPGLIDEDHVLVLPDGGRATVYNDADPVTGTSDWYGSTPPSVVKWAGMEEHGTNPLLEIENPGGNKRTSLAELNDDGKTFVEIANVINEKL